MRMWMVNPKILCRKHLLGEHVELHMFVGTINKGVGLDGYLNYNLMEPAALASRHEALATEIANRGYNHRSPLQKQERELSPEAMATVVNRDAALQELLRRCPECAARYSKGGFDE